MSTTIEDVCEKTDCNRSELRRHIERFRKLKMNVKTMTKDFDTPKKAEGIKESGGYYIYREACIGGTKTFHGSMVKCGRAIFVKRKKLGRFRTKCQGCGECYVGTMLDHDE